MRHSAFGSSSPVCLESLLQKGLDGSNGFGLDKGIENLTVADDKKRRNRADVKALL